MDEVIVKAEPSVTPTPKATPKPTLSSLDEETSIFVNESEIHTDLSPEVVPGPAFDPYQQTEASTELPITWKNCKDQDLAIQVQVREDAAKIGFTQLKQIESLMKLCAAEIPSAAKWLKRIGLFQFILTASYANTL
jgi:hypothetical protein